MLLTTDRLTMREFSPEDLANLLPFAEYPDQIKYMAFSLKDKDECFSFLNYAVSESLAKKRLEYHLAVENAADKTFLGSAALMIEKDNPSSAELGYWFNQKYWGRGYASEASSELIRFGFQELTLHRIWAKCHSENKASAKVMEKCGMQYEGTIREHIWLRDHYRTSLLYSILDREFFTSKMTNR